MRRFTWTFTGLIVGALAAVVAVSAAGGGHGTYLPAAILFPFTMLISAVLGRIPAWLAAFALAQFPIYGLLVVIGHAPRRLWVGVLCFHVVFAAAALYLVIRSDSFG
jgi:hypothetical protein